MDAILFGELHLSSNMVENMDMREIDDRIQGWKDLQKIKWGNGEEEQSDEPDYIEDFADFTDEDEPMVFKAEEFQKFPTLEQI